MYPLVYGYTKTIDWLIFTDYMYYRNVLCLAVASNGTDMEASVSVAVGKGSHVLKGK